MAKKQDSFYFENFIRCTEFSCQAAHLLERVLESFDRDTLPQRLDEIHQVEHSADGQKHILLDALNHAFITPIEREDILLLSQSIDELTDKLEDVLICIYYNNVPSIQPDALELSRVVIRCCESVKDMMTEFADFRHSKTLHDRIIQINTMEEAADKLYISSMYRLHTSGHDALTVMAWQEIYAYLEKCADACEHIADAVESVIMKNS